VAIYGNLEEAGLADVLQLLALGRKSGCLSVADGALHGEIYLSGGKVTFATVTGSAERFGEILVRNGLITRDQLQAAIHEQARGPKRQLGRILVDAGQISRADLDRFVRLQVEEAVYLLFSRRRGEFSFLAEQRTVPQALREPLDPQLLFLEGARRVDEWSQIQRKIPSLDLVYRHTKDTHVATVAAELTEAQRRILPLLDGTRDVSGLVDATGMGEFEVGKALYGLILAGFAQLAERRVAVRHLDYRELLAWVVREAEFADPARRKEAGRHIVDCPTCAERLRTIQVRRTAGSAVRSAAVVAAAPVAPAAPPHPAPASTVPAPEPRIAAAGPPPERRVGDRRVRDRRAGLDRRQGDRRCGLDRRLDVDPALSQPHRERRRGPRRAEERRSSTGGDRRSGSGGVRGNEPTVAAPEERRAGPGGRITEPRLIQRVEAQDRDWPLRVNLPAASLQEASEPVLAAAGLVWEGAAAAPEQPGAAATERESVPGLGREIEWLVTHAESTEMFRAAPPETYRPAEQAGAPRGVPSSAPLPDRPIPPSAVRPFSAPEPRRAPMIPGHLTWGGAEPRPSEDHGPRPATLDLRGLPLRTLAIAGVIALLGIAGYSAGRIAKRGGSPRSGRPTAAAPSAPASGAQIGAGRSGAPGSSPERQIAEDTAAGGRLRAGVPVVPQIAGDTAAARGLPRGVSAVPQAGAPTGGQTALPAAAPTRQPAPPPAPIVRILRGVVRGPGGAGVPGARVSVRGTALAAVADASGAFEIAGVPEGAVRVRASADGYVAATADARARGGAALNADVTLARVPAPAPAPAAAAPAVPTAPARAAVEPDWELSEGGWNVVSRADALAALGGTLGAIGGLPIESIAKSTPGARLRVRVAQIAHGGQRIVLTETPAGAAERGDQGPAQVTGLSVVSASEAYPFATGAANFGNILITAKSGAPVDQLRSLLCRLTEVRP
jgi:hypothetical protein